ncbi:MAG: hypothetical protein AB7U46_10925 [Paenirhodobacter sp.]|uniref:hypothetical protein n=1 Tax=Paenirhodobacter sp. TaxID=1965326 RepID=UPI003D0B1248
MVRGLALAAALVMAGAAGAEEAPRLGLTLVGAAPQEGGCRLSFLAENALGADLSALVLEAVLFTRAGGFERLMLLDFRDLPQGRPRLRQFDLPGADCAALGQVLVNGAARCDGVAEGGCIAALAPASRVAGMEVTG